MMQIRTVQNTTVELTTTMRGWPLINGVRVGRITLKDGILHMLVRDRTYQIALEDYLEQVAPGQLAPAY